MNIIMLVLGDISQNHSTTRSNKHEKQRRGVCLKIVENDIVSTHDIKILITIL